MKAELIDIAGTTISFTRQGDADHDVLFLIHCGGGHSGWWSQVAPVLAQKHHVVTLDLSGHGDSARRPDYEPEFWAEEVASLIRRVVPERQATLAGHSLGGLVSIYTAASAPALVGKLILIDPPVLHVEARDTILLSKTYERQEDAIARFRLRPPETRASRERLQEVAMQGLKHTSGGWAWKYDPSASQRFTVEGVAKVLAEVRCPIHCIYGELSPYVDRGTVDYIGDTAGRAVAAAVIPDAYHHVPLDAPAELAAEIDAAMLAQA